MNPVTLPVAWTHRLPTVRHGGSCAQTAAETGADAEVRSWSLQRRNALSPRQFAACFAAVALVSGVVGTLFWLMGARYVAGFAGLEVVLVGLAFGWHAAHAADGEQIRLHGGELLLEGRQGLHSWQERVSLAGLQFAAAGDGTITLRSGHRSWVVGRLATAAQRRHVLTEIRRALARTPD